jgi:hypothetical protein
VTDLEVGTEGLDGGGGKFLGDEYDGLGLRHGLPSWSVGESDATLGFLRCCIHGPGMAGVDRGSRLPAGQSITACVKVALRA